MDSEPPENETLLRQPPAPQAVNPNPSKGKKTNIEALMICGVYSGVYIYRDLGGNRTIYDVINQEIL